MPRLGLPVYGLEFSKTILAKDQAFDESRIFMLRSLLQAFATKLIPNHCCGKANRFSPGRTRSESNSGPRPRRGASQVNDQTTLLPGSIKWSARCALSETGNLSPVLV